MTGPVNVVQARPEDSLDIRIEVNPNAYHGDRGDPRFYIARFSDASVIPNIDDEVTVIQPDDDPSADFVSTAHVIDVDYENHLIKLYVNWKEFHDVEPNHRPVIPTARYTAVNYSTAVLISA